jgi:hypothetical protein
MSQGWGPPDPPPQPPEWGQNEQYMKGPDTRPWWKKKRFLIPILSVVGLIVVGGLLAEPVPPGVPTSITQVRVAAPTTETTELETTTTEEETTTTEEIATTKPTPLAAHKNISARQWDLIYKNPDAHVGERIIVYGEIFQFDSATGDDSFLANVDGVRRVEYGIALYEDNTAMMGDASKFADFVEEDMFVARVTVEGSLDYDTQIGGNTTVPLLQVDSIKRTGSSG